ncbi:hypothetical protein [Nonomuraea glycinis]|uniref:hypothetical protein n=1 Tax=Nonomuraea glycinis TaxID=2047744 RepID=UPI002E0F3CDF|nr:hypothetical protein OHA68_12345 [Nonomuraea glycinis]
MAGLLRGVEDEVPISYGLFDLRDGSGLGREAEEEEAGSLLAGPGAIALGQLRIKSQAWARTARVRMEAWDAEPPAPGEPWAEAGQVIYLSPGGTVLLCSLSYSPSGQALLLGPPFFAYGVRAYIGPVRTQPADYDENVSEAVEEAWLLRFWPLADTAGPVLRAETERTGWDPERMRDVLPPAPDTMMVRPDLWPALLPSAGSEPPLRLAPSAPPERVSHDEFTSYPFIPQETADAWRRIEETLGDLRIDMLGNLPSKIKSWPQSELDRYAVQLRVSMRIGKELNPHDAPTCRLDPASVRTVLLGPAPGVSGRAWTYGEDENDHAEVFSVDRQVIARDRIRRLTLLTGIVTILRHENELVEVRAATEMEAARVLMVEGMRG